MGMDKYVILRSVDGIPGEYSSSYSEAKRILEEEIEEIQENFEEYDIDVFDGVAIYKLITYKCFKVDMEATEEYLERCKEDGEEPEYEDILMIDEINYEDVELDKISTEDLIGELKRRKMMM